MGPETAPANENEEFTPTGGSLARAGTFRHGLRTRTRYRVNGAPPLPRESHCETSQCD